MHEKCLERNYSSSKVKMFTCPTVFLLTFYHNFISFFFQTNNSHDPSSMQTRTILRRELQEVYYVMKHRARTKDY